MRKRGVRRLAVTLLAAGALLTGGAARASEKVSITLPAEHTALPPGPGSEVTETRCRLCHSLDYIWTQPRGGRAQWQGVVTKMQKVFGAPISDREAAAIVDYLTAHYSAD
jgi:cytochrome c5